MTPTTLHKAVDESKKDGVGSGWCGRGVWSVLTKIGYGDGIRSGDGQDWEDILAEAGWIPFDCPDPSLAPYGSVLVYLSDIILHGKNLVGTKGGRYGHVELVAKDRKGRRVYVSDAARSSAGGTVPFNFVKRAWLPPSVVRMAGIPAAIEGMRGKLLRPSLFHPKSLQAASEELRNERLRLAEQFFGNLAYMQKGA